MENNTWIYLVVLWGPPLCALSFDSRLLTTKILTVTNNIFKQNFKLEGSEVSKMKYWAIINVNKIGVPDAPRKTAFARFSLLTNQNVSTLPTPWMVLFMTHMNI